MLDSLFLAAMGLRASIPLLAVGGFGSLFMMPFINASSQAIWQAKVAPDVQGQRLRRPTRHRHVSQIAAPLLAAPLADHVFKPAMSVGGGLAPVLGPVLGVGASRGVGLMVTIFGGLSVAVSAAAFRSRNITHVEQDLPDHGAAPAQTPAAPLSQPAD